MDCTARTTQHQLDGRSTHDRERTSWATSHGPLDWTNSTIAQEPHCSLKTTLRDDYGLAQRRKQTSPKHSTTTTPQQAQIHHATGHILEDPFLRSLLSFVTTGREVYEGLNFDDEREIFEIVFARDKMKQMAVFHQQYAGKPGFMGCINEAKRDSMGSALWQMLRTWPRTACPSPGRFAAAALCASR